jgi:hypothetical protein
MPHWIVLLAAVVAAWLLLAIGVGYAIGWSIEAVERWLLKHRPRRPRISRLRRF